jgi:hypothetical protein
MAGRKVRNLRIPQGRTAGGYGRTDEVQPGDEQEGQWTRDEREHMDERFRKAMQAALLNAKRDRG